MVPHSRESHTRRALGTADAAASTLISDGRGLVGRVLEAELERVAAPAVLRDIVSEPLAPLVDGKAGEGGVVLVPFGDELLEVARAVQPHTRVRAEQGEEGVEAHPARCLELAWASGGEIAHDEGLKLLPQYFGRRVPRGCRRETLQRCPGKIRSGERLQQGGAVGRRRRKRLQLDAAAGRRRRRRLNIGSVLQVLRDRHGGMCSGHGLVRCCWNNHSAALLHGRANVLLRFRRLPLCCHFHQGRCRQLLPSRARHNTAPPTRALCE